MHLKSLAIAGSAVFLAACSNGSGGSDGPDFSSTFAMAANYDPTVDDGVVSLRDTLYDDVVDEGISGFAGTTDGQIIPIKVRVSEDGSTVYVSFDGAAEQAFDTQTRTYPSGGGIWTADAGANEALVLVSDHTARFESSGALESYGYAFLLTPEADLPTGSVTYSGQFLLYAASGGDVEGDLGLTVDFASGSVDGALIGSFETGGGQVAIFGVIDGQMDGSLLGATITSSGGPVVDLDMLGGVSSGGVAISGAIAGTIEGETVGGQFAVDSEGSNF